MAIIKGEGGSVTVTGKDSASGKTVSISKSGVVTSSESSVSGSSSPVKSSSSSSSVIHRGTPDPTGGVAKEGEVLDASGRIYTDAPAIHRGYSDPTGAMPRPGETLVASGRISQAQTGAVYASKSLGAMSSEQTINPLTQPAQHVSISGYDYTYNPATGRLERIDSEGVVFSRPLYDEQTAGYTLGEAITRGYIREVKTDEGIQYAFYEQTPADIRKSILNKLASTGYDVRQGRGGLLSFTKHDFGLTSQKQSAVTGQPETTGRTLFDFSTNTIYDETTGTSITMPTPTHTGVEQEARQKITSKKIADLESIDLRLPEGASPSTAVEYAKLAGEKAKTKYDAQSLGEVPTEQFDFTKPYYRAGISVPTTQPPSLKDYEIQKRIEKEGEFFSFQDFITPASKAYLGITQPMTIDVSTGKTYGSEVGSNIQYYTDIVPAKIKLGTSKARAALGGESEQGFGPAYYGGSLAYFAAQGGYLAADTAFTLITYGKGAQAAATGASMIAERGLIGGSFDVAKIAVSETSKILGSPTYLITGLTNLPATQKAQIGSIVGGTLLASATLRATNVVPADSSIGSVGQGVIDVGQKFGRYVTFTSKPGEREDIVASATIFNLPYYGAKLFNVQPTGLTSKAVEVVYRAANLGAAGFIGYKAAKDIEKETGKPDYGRAVGRSFAEIGIFEYQFEAMTIDEAFEATRAYKGAQAKLSELTESKAINIKEYSHYWSGVETPSVSPSADISGFSGFSFDIRPTPKSFVELEPGLTVKAPSSADIGGKVTSRPDFFGEITPKSYVSEDVRPDYIKGAALDVKPDTRVEIHPIDTHLDIGKLDVRSDVRESKSFDLKTDTKLDIRSLEPRSDLRIDIRPTEDIKLPGEDIPARTSDIPTDIRNDIRADIRPDIRVDTKIDMSNPGVLAAGFLPFLGGGEGKGERAYGSRTKVQGEAKDLLSVFLGEAPKKPASTPQVTQSTPLRKEVANDLFSYFKKSKRR